MPAGKGSGQADGVFPRKVVHFAGETTVPAAPTRIAVLSTGQADALLTLGLAPTASTAGDGAETIPAYLTKAFPQQSTALAKVANVGGRAEPDVEAIAQARPELILINKASKDDIATLYQSLSRIAPTVVTQGTGLYWKQDFLLVGDTVGKVDAANTWLADYHSKAADFGRSVQGSPTVSFIRKNGDRIRVFGVASFAGSVAEDAGLARPESQTFTDKTSTDLSGEQLQQADGDRVFYGVQGGKDAELTGLPLWSTLTAVSAGHAVSVDDDTFYLNTGPTAAAGVLDVLQKSLG